MSDRLHRLARRITSFVENPVTNLVKGLSLFLIGFSEASRTFREDIEYGRVRVGHGLIIIGIFGILTALPHFLDGFEASKRYFDPRGEKSRTVPDPAAPEPGPTSR